MSRLYTHLAIALLLAVATATAAGALAPGDYAEYRVHVHYSAFIPPHGPIDVAIDAIVTYRVTKVLGATAANATGAKVYEVVISVKPLNIVVKKFPGSNEKAAEEIKKALSKPQSAILNPALCAATPGPIQRLGGIELPFYCDPKAIERLPKLFKELPLLRNATVRLERQGNRMILDVESKTIRLHAVYSATGLLLSLDASANLRLATRGTNATAQQEAYANSYTRAELLSTNIAGKAGTPVSATTAATAIALNPQQARTAEIIVIAALAAILVSVAAALVAARRM